MRSFGYAFAGIGFMLRTQHNAWIHLVATALVVGVSAFLHVSVADWRWIVVAVAIVWSAEAFNTAVEYVCDMVSPEHSEIVKHAKDIAAGSVLLSALGAAILGALTLWPYMH